VGLLKVPSHKLKIRAIANTDEPFTQAVPALKPFNAGTELDPAHIVRGRLAPA
jgi:hypothetical protein